MRATIGTGRGHPFLGVGILALGLAACGGSVEAAAPDEEPPAAAEGVDLGIPAVTEDRLERESPSRIDRGRAAPPRSPEGFDARQRAKGAARDALERSLRAVMARGVATARQASKGKVTGSNSVVAVHVRDLDSGAELASIQGGSALIPASNLKVLTVAAAIEGMGEDSAFRTRFDLCGPIRDGRLEGDLVVRAGGDPVHRRIDDPRVAFPGDVDWWTDAVLADLEARGIREVAGRLLLDDSNWGRPAPGPEWPSANQHWKDYCALAGGFSANGGCLTARVTPQSPGGNAAVTLRPRDIGIGQRIGVKTGAKGSGNDVRVGATASHATVRGSLAAGLPPLVSEFAHPDPVELFGHALLGALGRGGVTVTGGLARVDADGPTGLPEPSDTFTVRTPIAETFIAILHDSNNPVADQLFYAAAHRATGRGDREHGESAIRAALDALGVDASGLRVVDGSGLSKANRIAPRQLTAILAALSRAPALRAFEEALPLAGTSKKLGSRMKGTAAEGRVRAKTGFVSGASGLSGIAETLDGRRLAFSILVNYPRVGGINNAAWKPMQDDICVALVESQRDGGR